MAQAKKRKKFYDVDMPLIRKETNLIAFDSSELEGRTIRYDLTRMLKGKNVILTLRVQNKDGKFVAAPRKIETIHSSLSRMVRRGTDYVEDSFTVNCKDAKILIKPFLITRRKVHQSIRRSLRNKAKEEITEYLLNKKSDELFEEIIRNQFQKHLSLRLKKIYPLSSCEIRVLEVKDSIEIKEEKSKPDKEPGKNLSEEIENKE